MYRHVPGANPDIDSAISGSDDYSKINSKKDKEFSGHNPDDLTIPFSWDDIAASGKAPQRVIMERMKQMKRHDPNERRQVIASLDREFFQAAEMGNLKRLRAFLSSEFPVNHQCRLTGKTALHFAAAAGARKTALFLMRTGQCDYLLRDKRGYLASSHANIFGHDPAMARLLTRLELKQAEEQGIHLTRMPKR